MKTVTQRIEQAKAEITADVKDGLVSADVSSFSELHDYVDANYYGGWIDDDVPFRGEEDLPDVNIMQNAVDAWIKAGGLRGL